MSAPTKLVREQPQPSIPHTMTMTSQKIYELSNQIADAVLNEQNGHRDKNGFVDHNGWTFVDIVNTVKAVLEHNITTEHPVEDRLVRITGNEPELAFFNLVGESSDDDSRPGISEWYWTLPIDRADQLNEQFKDITGYEFRRSVV